MSEKINKQEDTENLEVSNVSFFLAWCKKCGNCAAFCPTKALSLDQWGYPYMEAPEKCKACHLCEKLCPDFAIYVDSSEMPPEDAKKTE